MTVRFTNQQVELTDVRHIRVHGDKQSYCGHPRQGGIFNFGNGEIAYIHFHAPCNYARPEDVRHDEGGYHSRAVTLLQRSLDHGETWPSPLEVPLWDESAPLEERRRILYPEDRTREQIDLNDPNSAFFCGRTYSGDELPDGRHHMICFALRSADKGKSWERVPTIINPAPHVQQIHKDGHPMVHLPDGSMLSAMTGGGGSVPGQVMLYGSDDNGLSWEYLAEIARDHTGEGRPTYAGLLLLPSGRLLCFMLQLGGAGNFLGMNHSDDGGYSWSKFRPIVRWGASPWRAGMRHEKAGRYGVYYRSPWPMLLRDGRILLLFARRKAPYGIGGIVSNDNGQSWSNEFVVRDDANQHDLGYPVATQLDDGRIFTAYYYNLDDGNAFGGTRFIAGSFFNVKS